MTSEEKRKKKDDERRELAAMMLVDAVFDTDAVVAKRYGKSADTLERYRAQLAADPVLRGMVAARTEERRRAWAAQLPVSINNTLRAIDAVIVNITNDPNFKANPGTVRELTGYAEVLVKAELTNKAIDARRNADRNRPDGGQAIREGVEGGNGSGDAERPN